MMGFLLSRFGLTAIAIVVSLFGFQAWKLHYGSVKKQEGKREVITESVEVGKLNNAKNSKSDARISTDDKYFDWMFRKYCRDCK